MDIWRWVHDAAQYWTDENPRLAWMIYRFPGLVVDNHHEQVDALLPEALALAKESRQPWLEVFFRHWDLQSRILKRSLVRDALPDAVDLLERAHREDARECPQSVCVSQDICVAYGKADGAGYAEERLKVSRETLDRITPAWPCWRCICGEYAGALLDLERYEEALDFVDEQVLAIQQAGGDDNRDSLRGSVVSALVGLGRLEEALAFNEQAEHEALGDSYLLSKSIDQARLLAKLGRWEEARDVLPPWEDVEGVGSDYLGWCEAVYLLAREKELQRPAVPPLAKAYQQLFSQGVNRDSLDIALWSGELLCLGEHLLLAEQVLEDAEAIFQELVAPLGADKKIDAFRQQILAAKAEEPVFTEEDLDALMAEVDAGQAIHAVSLLRAFAAFPERWELVEAMCSLWERYEMHHRALAALEHYCAQHPQEGQAIFALASLLSEQGQERAFLSFCQRFSSAEDVFLSSGILALQAQWYEKKGEISKAIEYAVDSLELAWRGDLAFTLAAWLRQEGNLEEALAILEQAEEHEPDDQSYVWQRMLVGTRLERWDVVRDAGEKLGFSVPDEIGYTWGEGGLCRVWFEEEGRTYVAMRMGPVTASVLELATFDEIQHMDDLVTIEIPALNWEAIEEAEGDPDAQILPHFRVDKVIRSGGFQVFDIDGVHPGEDALMELRERLGSLGCAFQPRSGEQYALYEQSDDYEEDESFEDVEASETYESLEQGEGFDGYDGEGELLVSEDGEVLETEEDLSELLGDVPSLPGVYALVGVPPQCDLVALEALLAAFVEEKQVFWVWRRLLEKLFEENEGSEDHEKMEMWEARATAQEVFAMRYGLS
ncbi:MAG: hypothetical protein H6727_18880 [Myxococcales bacterium]|nr:hypothetical protein [Myxococcales bacterium]